MTSTNDSNQAADDVIDDAAQDDTVIPEPYNITSFGADFDVEGIVRRMRKGEIFIPPFQREYVWNQKDASRFIESLLLGLPVPGVFFATDADRKFLVIDGQQRLKTLLFYYDGFFNPRPHERSHRVFKLIGVQKQFEGLSYEQLEDKDQRRLDNSIIHATVVKQDTPEDDDTSVFHIFERLNNGGRKLTDQEIRVALYHGPLLDAIEMWNSYPSWRVIFGPPSPRLKDHEFILRYLALLVEGHKYEKPMKEFLNKFAARHRRLPDAKRAVWQELFTDSIDVMAENVGKAAFRPTGAINAAVFDSVMVGLSTRLQEGPITDGQAVVDAYERLLKNADFADYTSRATSDETAVQSRVDAAKEAFSEVP